MPFRVRHDINHGENESLWIELTNLKCKPTFVCSLYRVSSVDFDEFISNLYNCMLAIDLYKCNLILLGDLISGSGSKQNKIKLANFARSMDLSQIISEPTRNTDNSRSLTVLIFVNNQHRIVDSGVVPLSISDHS